MPYSHHSATGIVTDAGHDKEGDQIESMNQFCLSKGSHSQSLELLLLACILPRAPNIFQ